MRKVARRLAVDSDAFHPEALQKARHYDPAHAVDGVEHHLESGLANGLCVHRFERED